MIQRIYYSFNEGEQVPLVPLMRFYGKQLRLVHKCTKRQAPPSRWAAPKKRSLN